MEIKLEDGMLIYMQQVKRIIMGGMLNFLIQIVWVCCTIKSWGQTKSADAVSKLYMYETFIGFLE